MSAETRVFLVDDHPMIRQGCRRLLEQSNINVAGEGDGGKNALQSVLVEAVKKVAQGEVYLRKL